MESKGPQFTPGPWVDVGNECDTCNAHIRADKTIIGLVYSGRRESSANALLVAHAPELYAALQAIFDAPCSWKASNLSPELRDAMRNADLALCRARGE